MTGIFRFNRILRVFLRWLLKAAAWGLGGFILWQTFRAISWTQLGNLLSENGLRLLFTLAVYPVVCVFHVLGFRALLSTEPRKNIGFRRLYGIYFQGDALNKVTPFADVGGEPLVVSLLHREGTSVAEAVRTVYLARAAYVFGEAVLIAVGTTAAMVFNPTPFILAAGCIGFGVSTMFLCLFVFSKRAWAPILTAAAGKKAEKIDLPRLRDVIAEKKAGLVVSILWNELAWALLFLEIYVPLMLMNAEVGLFQAFVIHAVLRAVQTATFFIPMSLGAQEGGLEHLTVIAGFPSGYGLAVSLVKRLRQWLFALGVLLYRLAVKVESGSSFKK